METPKRPPHLKDLFKTGQMLSIPVRNEEDPDTPIHIDLWIRKPSANQHEEALTKGRAAAAKRRNQYRDKESDLYVSMIEQVNEYRTKDELAERLIIYEESKYRQQAYHEILFAEVDEDSDEEPRWGKDGQHYLDLLGAIRERYEEIIRLNDELTPDEAHLRISLEEDEEIVRLNSEQEEFQAEVEERYTQIREREKSKLLAKSKEELRQILTKRLIELDVGTVFFQEYKSRLLYFSCRYPDQRDKLYWDAPGDIWEQPEYVQVKIMSALDELEVGVDDLKNSLSLLPS